MSVAARVDTFKEFKKSNLINSKFICRVDDHVFIKYKKQRYTLPVPDVYFIKHV